MVRLNVKNALFFFFLLLPLFAFARTRKGQETVSLEDMLPAASKYLSPSGWQQGMPFVLLRDAVGLSLTPEQPLAVQDTASGRGAVWHYDSMVSEEDWMGQELLQLRFFSPQGAAYRFSTGRPMSVALDKNYQPVLGSLYPLDLIREVDSSLRACTFFILLNDERVHYSADTIPGMKHEKFVPIVVDSVTCGDELAPLSVHFHKVSSDGSSSDEGYFLASLPGSREMGTSTSIERFLSTADPYLLHPDITREVWGLIKVGSVRTDMTSEEVRLSWGRPLKVEKGASRNGMIELWHYSNNRVLQIWDGRLFKIGVL